MRNARNAFVFLMLLAFLAFRPAGAADRIEFTAQTLDNGLEVIYAPLRQAPVVHVRVVYHVGSRDEKPDRQGFAHMFEHMMFRGSAHVKPEEHMKLINMVGGYSNAFTSFDQTVYVNTIPANQLELALYLEADRMASFKVSEQIFSIERNVVAEEWRRQQNAPYGTVYEDFPKLLYRKHSYRWPVIGNMDQLRAASAAELQQFFNTYYIPNNAVLVIAGDIDVPAAQALVAKYFAWIPKGAPVQRRSPPEPPQAQMRQEVIGKAVPLPLVMVGYHIPPYRSDDQYALTLLANILGRGSSSRLDRLLVTSANPLCVDVGTNSQALEDGGFLVVSGTVLAGKSPQEVEKVFLSAVADVVAKGVTDEEMAKAKIAEKVDFVRDRETAERIASALGREATFGGDPTRVNTALPKIEALTADDVRRVARKYLESSESSVLVIKPDPSAREQVPPTAVTKPAANGGATQPRAVRFPAGYPIQPPISDAKLKATFAKGTESTNNGVQVIVMPDHRLPFVTWAMIMRAGSYSDPAGKEGVAQLTADLVRRGAGGLSYDQLNEDLESRGISIAVNDADDHTQLNGSCLTEQLEHAIQRSREVLLSPALAADEFARLKQQTLSGLQYQEALPNTAAQQELQMALFGTSPLGRFATPHSVGALTLDDAKACYGRLYRPTDGIFVIAGDVTVERGQQFARKLLSGWEAAKLPVPEYSLPPEGPKLRIILVDRPEGRQSMIRMGARAYDIHSQEKFAGALANGILSSGIEGRLGRYVRAQKGLVYSVRGIFEPARHGGQFRGGAETRTQTTAETIEAMFKVFADTGKEGVTEEEMTEAKLRALGGMVMGMQTMQQQANYRVEGILNDYPIDYYDRYPERISAVSPSQVGQVVAKYLKPERMTVVVVAPAADVKEQLDKLGPVQVVPMPSRRAVVTRPAR